nr:recombinase family protein [uncultured Duganella sp.]
MARGSATYPPDTAASSIRAAAYVRMSTDRQEYSTSNQLDRIREYATAHNISIEHIYEDAGKSGLTIGGRPALAKLMADVMAPHDFHILLVYDVSRWGRFQDIDESAYYEVHCRKHGVNIVYCAEDFKDDNSIYSAIQKVVARAGAAKFSQDLSVKVFAGQCRMVKMGYKPGGAAVYGLRRMLLANDGSPICVLEQGQRKVIQDQHVVLVPGPPEEIEVVNQIFRWYAEDRIGDRRIASVLNHLGIAHPDGRRWTPDVIRSMLKNEKYIGNLIFNKASFKLRKKATRNPPESWVRCNAAFPAIVPSELFDAAQRERARRHRRYSKQELSDILLEIYRQHGRISGALIDRDPAAPTSRLIARHFGTLLRACDSIGIPRKTGSEFLATRSRAYALRSTVQVNVEALARQAGVACERLPARYSLRLNGNVVVAIRTMCCRHELKYGYRRWQGPTPAALGVDFILAAQLDDLNNKILRYLLLPAAEFVGNSFEFTEKGVGRFRMQSSRLEDFFRLNQSGFIC